MLKRFYEIGNLLKPGKATLIYGPRRVGKTTIVKEFLKNTELKYKSVSGDNIKVANILSSQNFDDILDFAERYDLLFIDEAQQIPNIGMGLKILVDNIPGIKIIATGSSSFELARKTGEPLTGRKRTFILYPLAQMELRNEFNKFELKEKLPEYLLYGSYPETIIAESKNEKAEVLYELVDSYLLKDIFTFEMLKSSEKLLKLLKLLAFQIGSLVSLNELATQVGLDVKTIDRYLDILEKSFVIKKVSGYSGNLRKEVTSKSKYYFWDNGIRNAVISQFNELEDRIDVGALFENFVMMERIKYNSYHRTHSNIYFWRTYEGKEIDIIEESGDKLTALEIKFSEKSKAKGISHWNKYYPDSHTFVINRNNYLEFVS